MKQEKIIENLKNMGIKVKYGQYGYWDSVPFVENRAGRETFLAVKNCSGEIACLTNDTNYERTLQAIHYCQRDAGGMRESLNQIKFMVKINNQHYYEEYSKMSLDEKIERISRDCEFISKDIITDFLKGELIDKYSFEERYSL